MALQDLFVAASRKCLRVGKKPFSVSLSLDLAVQVLAVDLGLKPALLYDINTASAEQVQHYLSSLQSAQLVSKSLLTLVVSGDTLIVNPAVTISNLEQLLIRRTVAVMDVCHSREQPVITDIKRGDLKDMIQDLLDHLAEFGQRPEVNSPLVIGELSETWNLCTLFGILLGYPATYWFDQKRSFENCLTMTPLVVTKAMVTWQTGVEGHRSYLYSFSIPEVMKAETLSVLDDWNLRLQQRFQQQTVFSGLSVSRETVILPSVAL